MTAKYITLSAAALVLAVSACGKSKEDENRELYMQSCTEAGQTEDTCECVLDVLVEGGVALEDIADEAKATEAMSKLTMEDGLKLMACMGGQQ